MAKTVDKLLILVGDGATPEVFKSPCALNSRSIQFSAQVQEDQVLTCPGSDPDAFDPEPGWIEKVKTALSASARGSGKLAATDKPMWWDWFTGGEKNIRIYLRAKDKTELKGHFAMRALLSGFELGQEGDNGLVDVSATIDSSGPVEWVSTL